VQPSKVSSSPTCDAKMLPRSPYLWIPSVSGIVHARLVGPFVFKGDPKLLVFSSLFAHGLGSSVIGA